MKRTYGHWLVKLLGILILVVAVGCGSETAVTPEVDDEPTEATAVVEPTPDTATASTQIGRKGTLRVAIHPVVNIDPIEISSDSEVLLASHVYDYLIDIDHLSTPTPRLATSWRISQDGLAYTFQLADNVVWHDGSPFTAEDVVWTYERLRNTEGTPTANLYSNIAVIEANGDHEVIFTLKTANPFFLYDLSDNHALILKADITDAAENFNGTGPFIVTNYEPGVRVDLVANENYFVPEQPRLEALQIIFFAEDSVAIEALQAGDADLALRMSTNLFQLLEDDPNLSTFSIPTNGFDLVRLRSDRPPGDDPRVMQALRTATDRAAILNIVQQGYGIVGNDSPIGPLYTAYHSANVELPERDIEVAQELLNAAGYEDGLQLDLYVPDTGNRPALAAVLKEQWRSIGVDVNVIVVSESIYYGENKWLEVDLGITGWGSRPYPQFYLDQMLVTGAEWNEAHFSDPELDRLSEIARTTLNEQERIQAYYDIQQLLAERGPVLIPYYFAQFGALSNRFTNFDLKAFAGRTDLRTVIYTGE